MDSMDFLTKKKGPTIMEQKEEAQYVGTRTNLNAYRHYFINLFSLSQLSSLC
jgi:hypothetical protein